LKKSETKDQNAKRAQIEGLTCSLALWRHFHLNETARFRQNDAVSCISKKKKRKNKTVPF